MKLEVKRLVRIEPQGGILGSKKTCHGVVRCPLPRADFNKPQVPQVATEDGDGVEGGATPFDRLLVDADLTKQARPTTRRENEGQPGD